MLEGDGQHATNARKALSDEQDLLAALRQLAATLATAGQPPVVAAAVDENMHNNSNVENEENEVAHSSSLPTSSSSMLLPRSPLGRSNSANECLDHAGSPSSSGFLSPATKAAAQEIIANAGLGGSGTSGSGTSGNGKHPSQAPRSSGRLAARLQATARSPGVGVGGDKKVVEVDVLPQPPTIEDRGSENAAPPVAL